MKTIHRRRLIAVALAMFVVAPLSGCGKKSDPKPPRKDSSFPKTYPSGAPRSDAAPSGRSTGGLIDRQLAFKTEHGQ